MNLYHGVKRFLQDEAGQTTTEYILILAVIVTFIMQFRKKFQGILDGLFTKIGDEANQAMEAPSN